MWYEFIYENIRVTPMADKIRVTLDDLMTQNIGYLMT